ncbi:MAG: hypothetical protein KDB88_12405 [Flavobacteriales bacterium]|nr:hypothetical protein [Flavobacteriales bacterium]
MNSRTLLLISSVALLVSCKKEDPSPGQQPADGPRLILNFRFDSTQTRLDALGQPSPALPPGHAAQHPRFNAMSSHYVEFAPTAWTLPGMGAVVYHAPETNAGGAVAIDFDQSVLVGEGEAFLNVPLSSLPAGSYEWLRVSLGYQNYDVDLRYTDTVFGLGALDLTGTIASFIGFNTYISSFTVHEQQVALNDDRPQGFWAFELHDPLIPLAPITGQSAGVTTVPNPLFASSPIPANSCLVTGGFATPLVITGNETEDVVITVSLSTNNSFEWIDNGDGVYEPGAGDLVVDMGVRGLVPIVE